MATTQTATGESPVPVGWRFRVGMVLFVLGLIPYALIVPVVLSHLPLATLATATFAAVIAQKVVLVSSIPFLGKTGFTYLKRKVLGQLGRLAPPAAVGAVRYRIGLVMFCLPFLQGLAETYLSHLAPDLVQNRVWVDVGGDLMIIASLFVLGGDFWDKLRALFVWQATAQFPGEAATADRV